MFEKEAEEKSVLYVDKLAEERHFEKGTSYTAGLVEGYNDGFQDGAEFGYNKANEWHYVKDGDLPPEDTKVFALMADKEVYIAHFYRRNVWDKIGTVIAWKEIVLPELKENE